MGYRFPADVEKLIQKRMEEGRYASEDDVLRDALQALARQSADLAAIEAGVDDMEAGRFQSVEEFDAAFRQKNGIEPDA